MGYFMDDERFKALKELPFMKQVKRCGICEHLKEIRTSKYGATLQCKLHEEVTYYRNEVEVDDFYCDDFE